MNPGFRNFFLCVIVWLCGWLLPGSSQAAEEHQVKAVFLFHFANFVAWPVGAFADASTPLSFCMLAGAEVEPALAEVITGEHAQGRELKWRSLENPDAESMRGCHVIYAGESYFDDNSIDALLAETAGHDGLLTVSDYEGFVERGGMISLVIKKNRVHPLICVDCVNDADLRVSAKLLRLATVVRK